VKTASSYLLQGLYYSQFCLKICCHGRKGKILTTPSHSTDSKIGGRCTQRAIIFYGDRVISLWSFHTP